MDSTYHMEIKTDGSFKKLIALSIQLNSETVVGAQNQYVAMTSTLFITLYLHPVENLERGLTDCIKTLKGLSGKGGEL